MRNNPPPVQRRRRREKSSFLMPYSSRRYNPPIFVGLMMINVCKPSQGNTHAIPLHVLTKVGTESGSA